VKNYYKNYFPKCANQAKRIATVSNFSKNDIAQLYGIKKEKIDVVYNGANINFKPISLKEIASVKNNYTNKNPYFLFVGTLHSRKNLDYLFQAFNALKTQNNTNFKLLIVGKKMWWTKEIEKTYKHLKFKNDIIFTGRLAEKELYKITASAYALTYVPIFEGFGIPLVEAMSCGVPVITSKVTSMPEVVGNAGVLVNPFVVDEITEAMVKIVTDDEFRKELIEKSKIQVQKFSWQKTGDLLWKSILQTMDN